MNQNIFAKKYIPLIVWPNSQKSNLYSPERGWWHSDGREWRGRGVPLLCVLEHRLSRPTTRRLEEGNLWVSMALAVAIKTLFEWELLPALALELLGLMNTLLVPRQVGEQPKLQPTFWALVQAHCDAPKYTEYRKRQNIVTIQPIGISNHAREAWSRIAIDGAPNTAYILHFQTTNL